MAGTEWASVDRILKNAAGEVLRIDTVTMSGRVIRKNIYSLVRRGEVASDRLSLNYGDWIFHSSNGRQVKQELFHLGGARVVAEIEMLGSWDTADTTDFDWFTFVASGVTVTVDMEDLPDVGDTV